MVISNNQQNRLKTTLRQSGLEIFDIIGTNKQPISQFDNISTSLTQYSKAMVGLMSTFLRDKKEPVFHAIDSGGLKKLFELSESIEKQERTLGNVSLNTFFGATEEMPLRGLSYIIPSLKLVDELSTHYTGVIPEINYSFAATAGSIANNYDLSKIDDTNNKFIEMARYYIEQFHPLLVDKTHFLTDHNFVPKIMESQEFPKAVDILTSEVENVPELKSILLAYGEKRQSVQNSMAYTTLHIFSQDLIMDDDIAMTDYHTGETSVGGDLTIYIGAKPEERFFTARKLGAEKISRELGECGLRDSIQYILNMNVPPYSLLEKDDLLLTEALNNPDLIDSAQPRDWSSEKESRYQIPVQKAVEMVEADIRNSDSDVDFKGFIEICREKFE